MTLQELLETERNVWRGLGTAAWLMQDFILKHGRACKAQAKPYRFRWRQMRNCYWNAQEVVDKGRGRYQYAEGYVIREQIPIPILHGWAVDARDRVVDVTLRECAECQYYGIVFTPKQYKSMRPYGGGPLLDGLHGFQTDNWLKLDPGYKSVVDEAISASRSTVAAKLTTP